MKIILDTKKTDSHIFMNKEHRHLYIFSGKTKNSKWKDIRITQSIIPNCISIDTFDDETVIINIPKNLIEKGCIVRIDDVLKYV